MESIERQTKRMAAILRMAEAQKDGNTVTDSQIKRSFKPDGKTLMMLQDFTYDPHSCCDYRKLIGKLNLEDRIRCYVWWYLEGMFYSRRNMKYGRSYTNKICSKIGVNPDLVYDDLIYNYFI